MPQSRFTYDHACDAGPDDADGYVFLVYVYVRDYDFFYSHFFFHVCVCDDRHHVSAGDCDSYSRVYAGACVSPKTVKAASQS